MGEKLKPPPHYWTPKQDLIILELFDLVSTEKLSILMQVKTKSIIGRKQYLDNLYGDKRTSKAIPRPNSSAPKRI